MYKKKWIIVEQTWRYEYVQEYRIMDRKQPYIVKLNSYVTSSLKELVRAWRNIKKVQNSFGYDVVRHRLHVKKYEERKFELGATHES